MLKLYWNICKPALYIILHGILFFGFLNITVAQSVGELSGNVIDEKGTPLADVLVECQQQGKRTLTDKNGNFTLQITVPATIHLKLLGYEPLELEINKIDKSPVNITLKVSTFGLPEVGISSDKKPILIEKHLRLIDFELRNNELWYLYAYKKGHRIRTTYLSESKEQNDIFSRRVYSINKSAHNYIYLSATDSSYFMGYNDNQLSCIYSMSANRFQSAIEPLTGYSRPFYYYKREDGITQQTLFRLYNNESETFKIIYKCMNYEKALRNVVDAYSIGMQVEGLESQEKDINRVEPDVNASIPGLKLMAISKMNTEKRKTQEKYDFYENVVFTPLECELKIFKDSLFIFNFDIDSIFIFTLQGDYCRSLPISFNKKELHKRGMVIDENKSHIYFTYLNKGVLNIEQINPHTGTKIYSSEIKGHPYPKKFRIYDKEVYFFVWDKYEEAGKLFKQKL